MGAIGFVRHGESEWNRLGRVQGSLDIPLSQTGRAQAKTFAVAVRQRNIGQICTSPLQRAKETALIIAKVLESGGIVPHRHEMDELRERHYGHYQGCYLFRLRAERQLVDAEHLIVGGAVEPWRQLERRVCHAAGLLCERAAGNEDILAVVHGGWMKALRTLINRRVDGRNMDNLECIWVDSSDLAHLCCDAQKALLNREGEFGC